MESFTKLDGKTSEEKPEPVPIDIGIPGVVNTLTAAIRKYNERLRLNIVRLLFLVECHLPLSEPYPIRFDWRS